MTKMNASGPTSSTGLVNTCLYPPSGTKLFACNVRAITGDTILQVTFKNSTAAAIPVLALKTGTDSYTILNSGVSTAKDTDVASLRRHGCFLINMTCLRMVSP